MFKVMPFTTSNAKWWASLSMRTCPLRWHNECSPWANAPPKRSWSARSSKKHLTSEQKHVESTANKPMFWRRWPKKCLMATQNWCSNPLRWTTWKLSQEHRQLYPTKTISPSSIQWQKWIKWYSSLCWCPDKLQSLMLTRGKIRLHLSASSTWKDASAINLWRALLVRRLRAPLLLSYLHRSRCNACPREKKSPPSLQSTRPTLSRIPNLPSRWPFSIPLSRRCIKLRQWRIKSLSLKSLFPRTFRWLTDLQLQCKESKQKTPSHKTKMISRHLIRLRRQRLQLRSHVCRPSRTQKGLKSIHSSRIFNYRHYQRFRHHSWMTLTIPTEARN